MTKISNTTLQSITTAIVPDYARSDLSAGIVHFGVGNFHRAHQAVYLNELFSMGLSRDWALVGASVRQADALIRTKLQGQDWLTTVVQQEAETSAAIVTGAMIDYIEPGSCDAILAALLDPAIRVVSLTITEGGYYIDPASQRFDDTHPDIRVDAANIAFPNTTFGLIVAAIMQRREAGVAPFTVMSCDNIPGNGHVTENAVAGLAALIDPDLADWVRANIAFPNSMVDRITPATTEREREILARDFGIDDAWPVFCEDYRQWVLEDKFPSGRPALERVGVEFVADVMPYEHMKIRILNGGHAALAYPAGLLDYHYVHDAMNDSLLSAFLTKLTREEIIPVVPLVPNTDLTAYAALCHKRFANPKVGDTIARLAHDGSNRQPKFIIPTAHDRLEHGASVQGLALVSALWCRYCAGATDSGAVIPPNDPNWDRLHIQALQARNDPCLWLGMTDIYGDVGSNEVFAAAFSDSLRDLSHCGTKATLSAYLS